MRHKRVGRPSRYLSASLHYRTRRSSRKERAREAEAENRSLYQAPLALRRRINAITLHNPPTSLFPSFFANPLPIFPQNHPEPPRSRYVHDVKKSSRNRAVYVPTNFHSDSVNPIYIADRPSGNNRRDNKASSQIPNRPRSIVVYRKKRRKNDREFCDVIPADARC